VGPDGNGVIVPPSPGVVTLIKDGTQPGPGEAVNLNAQLIANTMQVIVGGDDPDTAVEVRLEGSLDSENWFMLCERIGPGAESDVWHHVIQYIRANILAITSGTVTVLSASA
jgi:hypothetical protein